MNESQVSRIARQREEELRAADLPTLMRKAAEMERNLKGKSDEPELPQVASGGSYL